MEKITYITTNAQKVQEAKYVFGSGYFNFVDLDLPEIQSLDAQAVAKAKLEAAKQQIDGRIMINDVSSYFGALDMKLPGPYNKSFFKALGAQGVADLVSRYEDSSARILCVVGFYDPLVGDSFFDEVSIGQIIAPRSEAPFLIDRVFQPDGSQKVFGEMTVVEKESSHCRYIALKTFKNYLEAI